MKYDGKDASKCAMRRLRGDALIRGAGLARIQITDKGLRTLVLRPLSYFTSIRISGIIEVQKEARRSADVYGKKRKAKQT